MAEGKCFAKSCKEFETCNGICSIKAPTYAPGLIQMFKPEFWDIDKDPVYCESKKQLKEECDKRGLESNLLKQQQDYGKIKTKG